MCSSVLFPDPLSPIIAIISPDSTRQIDAAQHVERNTVSADVPFGNAATLEDCRHSERIASTGYSFAAWMAG